MSEKIDPAPAQTLTIGGVTVALTAKDVAELAAEEKRWRAQGKLLVGQVERRRPSLTAASARKAPEKWTVIAVLDRLEEVYEVLGRLPMVTRPRGHANAMPAYVHEFADLVAQGETGELERLTRTRNQYRLRGATSAEIARVEEAIGWPARYLKDKPEVARTVQLAALWSAMKANTARKCKDAGINPKWFARQRLHGLTLIAMGLVRDGVRPQ